MHSAQGHSEVIPVLRSNAGQDLPLRTEAPVSLRSVRELTPHDIMESR